MKVRLFGIFVTLVGLLNAGAVSAQDLPLLPQDPAVKRSVFPNGHSCYAAENKSCKGAADFSLVRRDYEGNDMLFSKKNVILSSEQAVDSMLLSLMRRVEKDATPADCAVIVCGDIDAASVITKLKYMSLMVDASPASPLPEYTWGGDAKVRTDIADDTLTGLSTVRFEWCAPRVPHKNMNTIQSAVYDKAAWELGEIATAWIRRSLRMQDIPCTDVAYIHEEEKVSFADEKFAIEVTVMQEDARKAQVAVASVLSSLDRGDASENDVILLERKYMQALERSAGWPLMGNDEYTAMCRDAFLFNRALSTDKERLDFFLSKVVSASTRRNIFNKMASALLDVDGPYDTLCLSCGAMPSDTLGLPVPAELKTKMRSSRKDSFSGGQVWTFANGFKVIYRKMPSADRRMYYSMSLGGGFGNIEDLKEGEGEYVSDYLDHCWIAGMKRADLEDVLGLCGMTLETEINMYSTVISGQVEDNNVSLLMKSLLAMANECRPDTLALDYFARCKGLVSTEAFAKAESLYSSLTSKMNDGVLVLVGDMNESALKKQLQGYVGEFRVKKTAARRSMMNYQPSKGWAIYDIDDEGDAAKWEISAPVAMTAVNHFAAEIAAMILEHRIQSVFGARGVHAQLSFSRSILPDERFSIVVELSGKCCKEDAQQLKSILASCLSDVTEEELKFCREDLKNACQLQMQTAGYWLRVIPLRHMDGKDFTTGYAAKIDAVTPQVLQNVFRALADASEKEYITTKK